MVTCLYYFTLLLFNSLLYKTMNNTLSEIRKILAGNLKKKRRNLGYSQEKFAEISGLSVQTINDIEGGRKWVSDKTITKLSAALQIECYQLLLPDNTSQNIKETNQPQHLMGLMKELKKGVVLQIDEQFTDFLKSRMPK